MRHAAPTFRRKPPDFADEPLVETPRRENLSSTLLLIAAGPQTFALRYAFEPFTVPTREHSRLTYPAPWRQPRSLAQAAFIVSRNVSNSLRCVPPNSGISTVCVVSDTLTNLGSVAIDEVFLGENLMFRGR